MTQKKIERIAKEKIDRPNKVPNISIANQNNEYLYDPSVIIENDIKDQNGNIIVKFGTKYNPLEHIKLSDQLLFLNADIRPTYILLKNKKSVLK